MATAKATMVIPLNLTQLSQQATMIFHGRVLANRVKQDPLSRQIVTYTDFQIIEAIKGQPGKQYTIKQIGGKLPHSSLAMYVQGVPTFTVGKEYVVFLPTPSKSGFCSPLGLYQGSFAITLVNGKKTVSSRHSATLANSYQRTSKMARAGTTISVPLATSPDHPGKAYLSDFINHIRTLNTE